METTSQPKLNKYMLYIIPVSILIIAIFIYKSNVFTPSFNYYYDLKDEVFVSIDFGNSKSSFAYNFVKNDKVVKSKITSVPSIVILNKENYVGKNYGKRSLNSISNYNEEEMNKIIFVDNLKVLLYNISSQKTSQNKTHFLLEYRAIVEFLRLFSDDIMREINSFGKNYIKEEINWSITAPRIWDDFAKMNLINFAKEAGMINIELALESEVAAISVLNDKIITENNKREGKIFLLIDLGNSKIDISLNEIIDNNIKQLAMPFGGNFGSMNINNDLIKVIKNVLGNQTIEKAKENQLDEYLQIMKDLEDIKKKFKEHSTNYFEIYTKFEIEKSFYIKIREIWNSIKSFFTRKNYLIDFTYKNYTIYLDKFKVAIPGKLIEEIILERVHEIINFIKLKSDNIKYYDYIVLTGGFSNSDILVKEFRKSFTNVHVLSNQENSVLEGSLIYLKNKEKIYSRVAYNTYGIGTILKNNKTNEFSEQIKVLIKKGDTIKHNFKFKKNLDNNSIKSDFICINFYKSSKENLSKDDYLGTLTINTSECKSNEQNLIKLKLKIRFNTYFQIDVFDINAKKKLKFSFLRKGYNFSLSAKK